MTARFIVGIDLGTTNTVVAFADTLTAGEGVLPRAQVFPLPQWVAAGEVASRPSLPSARYQATEEELPEARTLHTDGTPGVLGTLALELGARVPSRLVTSAKSWLCHGAVDRSAAILPWGAPAEVPKISPVEASASYLAHVRGAWDTEHPRHPLADQEVVLTVPASFDEAARALTLTAAKLAGLPKVRLVEEPLAAFYRFLGEHRSTLDAALGEVKLVVVVDCGGGTTDLTLIRVERRESGPRMTRIAVGDHLMLGGDNMDLLLAKRCEAQLSPERPLSALRFAQLVHECRGAKERLLSADAPESLAVTVLGSGSKLIGASLSARLVRDEVRASVLDGFFPEVTRDARPVRRAGGLMELGLPYAADAAVTRHLTAFLARHEDLAQEAVGEGVPLPDAVLFNGGVFRSDLLRERVTTTLEALRGAPVRALPHDEPDLAVALGAVAYGLARRGVGLRVGGGSARSYFLALPRETKPGSDPSSAPAEAICLLPRGSEEGEEIALRGKQFSLKLGRPVRFHLLSSTADVRHVSVGERVLLDDPERYTSLPPIAAVLDAAGGQSSSAASGDAEVTVELVTALTEVGTLEMSCVRTEDARARWKLEFQIRGQDDAQLAALHVGQLHPRFAEATARVREVYGKAKDSADVQAKDVKRLRADLEKILGPREGWDTPLLRELFGALFAGVKNRRRSPDHERVWFNLVGYTLRPGFGYPLDEWRVKQLVQAALRAGVQFAPEPQNWSEHWTLFRRIAGGLDAAAQRELLDQVEWYLEPPSRKPKPKPAGPRMLAVDDMIRLAGSLERVGAERKAQVGGWLVTRLMEHDENPQAWWAVGRLGARVPLYGSAHDVVPPHVVHEWLERCLSVEWKSDATQAPMAAALMARRSGDRVRDVAEALREAVAARLEREGKSEAWVRMVREVTTLEAADERRFFGDSIPVGLRLLE
ncbi:MAG: hsp70 family protein [Sandaracinaceae bacterium]|jgi:molecular chaperone DnaK (HSP70)|nr:hsp70 family protein [Sandaracinaceae bacterium]MBP7681680.1 hsp70 family protein [Deltaproteobacteria bacterium]